MQDKGVDTGHPPQVKVNTIPKFLGVKRQNMTRVKKGGITGNYCTFDPIKCQLGHFEFALAVKALVGNLLEAIDFIIGCHRDSQSEKRANYQKYS